MNKLGENIKRLRLERKLSQEKLAVKADVHLNILGLIENGKTNPTVKTLLKIAKALGVKITDLFEDV